MKKKMMLILATITLMSCYNNDIKICVDGVMKILENDKLQISLTQLHPYLISQVHDKEKIKIAIIDLLKEINTSKEIVNRVKNNEYMVKIYYLDTATSGISATLVITEYDDINQLYVSFDDYSFICKLNKDKWNSLKQLIQEEI